MSTAFDPGPPERRADPRQPLGEIVSGLTEDLSKLMRQEVALAKAETKQEVSTAMRGIAMIAGAGVFALIALTLLSLAIAQWLSEYMDLGWAYLIVGVVWVVVAAVLVASGRRILQEVSPMPERTAETVREIPQAMKGNPS
jgi:uncharacterized membrane protein